MYSSRHFCMQILGKKSVRSAVRWLNRASVFFCRHFIDILSVPDKIKYQGIKDITFLLMQENVFINITCELKYYLLWWYIITLSLLYFLNGIIHLPFLEMSVVIFKNLKLVSQLYRAGQTSRIHRPVSLYTGDKG